ncbi:Zinc finger, CCHC-type [Melia azedarach]|uniref:Zinc finger, CCHC-type n=1 Tax=Melia azedarach TaxID=155640 RepID=A0ACC1XNN5_MELAZ|nr:Zinc finger, CCHC-type [Melia azedarach]
MELEDLLHLALKVEKQLKTRGSTNCFFFSTSSFKSNWRKDDKASSSKPKTEFKEASKTSNPSKDKGKLDSTINTRNIQCLKCQGVGHYKRDCPNQRNIFMLDGEYYSVSEEENGEEMMPSLEDVSDEERDEQLTMAKNGACEEPVVLKLVAFDLEIERTLLHLRRERRNRAANMAQERD